MTVREVLKILHKDGWQEVENRTKGTVASHSGDIAKGTMNSIMRQAGLK